MSSIKSFLRMLRGGLKVLLPVLAVAIGVGSFKYLKSSGPQPPKPQKRETVYVVRTQPVSIDAHQPKLQLYGEVKAGRKVELRSLVAGTVLRIGDNLREGAKVEKGDNLLVVDDFQYKGAVIEAKAKIAAAKARLKEIDAQIASEKEAIKFAEEQVQLSERDLNRALRLFRRGSATQQGADQRKLTVSQRRQALRSGRSGLLVLAAKRDQEQANLDSLEWKLLQAERNLKDTRLTAPFSGNVALVNANVGRLVNANDHVATLLDSGWIEVVFNLSDQQYGRIIGDQEGLVGRELYVKWYVASEPKVYEARIERVAAQISSETGGVSVYARLLNLPKGNQAGLIRAGAFVEVEVSDKLYEQVVRLPQTALYGRSKVYIVGDKQRLQERKVKMIGVDGEHVLLRGELKNGDRAVISRMSTIGGGLKVRDLSVQPERQKPHGKNRRRGPEMGGGTGDVEWKPTKGEPDRKGKHKVRRDSHLMLETGRMTGRDRG